MSVRSIVLAVSCVSIAVVPLSAGLWVNEFHYDNVGSDVGEFVEVTVSPGMTAGLDLSAVVVHLINGADEDSYGSASLLGKVPTSVNGFDFYSLSPADFSGTSSIQNDLEGIFLSFPGGTQFLSYEGVLSPSIGPANGLTSTDVGVSESSSTSLGSSLGLTGSGSTFSDFTWSVISVDTPGMLNAGQTVTAVPEPSQYLALTLVGIVGVTLSRTARSRVVSMLAALFQSKS